MHGRSRIEIGFVCLVALFGALAAPATRSAADEAESERVVERLEQITFLSHILRDLPLRVVAEDLKLSGEQCRELNRLHHVQDTASHAAIFIGDRRKQKAAWQQIDADARRGLIAVLSTEQLVRTHEIFCRLHGPTLLLTVVADELELTGPQELAVAAVNELHGRAKWKASEAVGSLSTNPDDMPEYRRKSLELARKKALLQLRATELMLELMVPEQRRKLESMYGRPLDIVRFFEEEERSYWDLGPDEPPDDSPSLAAPPIAPRR